MHAAPKFLEIVSINELSHLIGLLLSVGTIPASIRRSHVEISIRHLYNVEILAECRVVVNGNFFLVSISWHDFFK